MRVLLLSAYAAQSHRYWQTGLQAMFPEWQWRELNLPPRHFSWRVRGNPLYWSIAEREALLEQYDLLLATSMVDLATLRGLVPSLATIPTALYFHENQFDYPQHRQQHSLLEAQMVSLYSSLAADRLLFNSQFNCESFMTGCDTLLKRLPDYVPSGVVASLREKAAVLPVSLLDIGAGDAGAGDVGADAQPQGAGDTNHGAWGEQGDRIAGDPLRILWSGRFEHDKGGEGLLAILRLLVQEELDFELAVTGQQFRNSPPVFGEIEHEFAAQLVQFGYVESVSEFERLQRGADVILSTALHEFQGLAVMQAVAAGCVPLVPDRLAYREFYADSFRYQSHLDAPQQEAASAVARLLEMSSELGRGTLQAPSVAPWSAATLRSRYREELQGLLR